MKTNNNMRQIKEKLSIVAILFSLMNISLAKSPLLLLLAYLIHETGHIFFAKIMGAEIQKIKGGVFHLSISYDTKNLSYVKEAVVCSGGIVFNLISALIILLLNTSNNDTLSTIFVFNLSLALMNLYPVSILDGGGILKALLLSKIQGEVAEKVNKWISFFFAVILWIVSVYLQIVFSTNVSLPFISIYLLIQLCFSI
ncbi:MAG: site-2 protease family protein [Clostridia bacterium]|nr:site-2 protease family protein [Clostridia bacterium]